MKVVVAPDSFKGSLTASVAAAIVAAGLKRGWPDLEIDCVPLADGGEGTARIWVEACGGTWQEVCCCDPLGRPAIGHIGWIEDGRTAIVEVAEAVGLKFLSATERTPELASSFGLAALIEAAVQSPALETLWVTLGGSATVDGGIGCLQGLGVAVLDAAGNPVERGGRGLAQVRSVDWSGLCDRLRIDHPQSVALKIAGDVTNPLLGDRGAARVFGPQKGASPPVVEQLEQGMHNWALHSGKGDLAEIPGTGAAGGLGFALACLGAEIYAGIDCVMDAVGLAARLAGADLVITGEGRSDAQTAAGKVVSGVVRLAQSLTVPTLVLSGSIAIDELAELERMGVLALWDSIPGPMTDTEAMGRADAHLEWSACQLARTLRLGQRLGH